VKKATIAGEYNGQKIEVECLFNPKQYTISRTNSWTFKWSKGSNIPEPEFSTGDPATLKMQLFFDTTADNSDVRSKTKGLWQLMRIDPSKVNKKTKKAEPPEVMFQWGSIWSFSAVITSLAQTFTLFLKDGTPVRATVDITFKQAADELRFAATNPSSGAGEPHRVYTVKAGDRLDWIAYQEYGDPAMWRLIARENHLIRPRRLRPGETLIIPAL
jgi:hypothetical protein